MEEDNDMIEIEKFEPIENKSDEDEDEEDPFINNNEDSRELSEEFDHNNLIPLNRIKEEDDCNDNWMIDETFSSQSSDHEDTVKKSKRVGKSKRKTSKSKSVSSIRSKSSKSGSKSLKLKLKLSKVKSESSLKSPTKSSKSREKSTESISKSKTKSSKSRTKSSESISKLKTKPSKSRTKSSKSKLESSKIKTDSSAKLKSNSSPRDRRVKYPCEKCDLVFHRIHLYKDHLVTHQPDLASQEDYICPHPNCSRSFLSQGGLKNHLNFHSSTDLLHQCSFCPTDTCFQTQTELEVHQLENHSEEISESVNDSRLASLKRNAKRKKLHKCEHCTMVFGNIRMYKKHLLSHDESNFTESLSEYFDGPAKPVLAKSVKPAEIDSNLVENKSEVAADEITSEVVNIQCSQCQTEFTDKFKLDLHVVKVHGMPGKCSECDKTFATAARLFRHQNVHNEPHFKCRHLNCNASFRDQKTLTFHERKHAGMLPYDCPECRQSFRTRPLCVQHRIEVHGHKINSLRQSNTIGAERRPKRRERTSSLKFKCTWSDCEAIFKYQKSLEIHEKKHKGLLPYGCPVCSESFAMKQECYQHRIEVHNQKLSYATPNSSVQCETCGAVFKQKYTLNRHITRHHSGEKSFSCDICGKKFALKLDFDVHVKYHSGNFVCEICGRSTKSKGDLTKHKKIHISQIEEPPERKIYPCDLCSKKVHTRLRLIDHRKKHKTTIPYDFETLPFVPIPTDKDTNIFKKRKNRNKGKNESDETNFFNKKPKLTDWTAPVESIEPHQNYSGLNLFNPTVLNPFNFVPPCDTPIDYTYNQHNVCGAMPQHPRDYGSVVHNYQPIPEYIPNGLITNGVNNNFSTPLNNFASTSTGNNNNAYISPVNLNESKTNSEENDTLDSHPDSPMDFSDECADSPPSPEPEAENITPPCVGTAAILKTEVSDQAVTKVTIKSQVSVLCSIKKEKDPPLTEKLIELMKKHIGCRVLSINLTKLITYPCKPCKTQFHTQALHGKHCRTFQHRNTVRNYTPIEGNKSTWSSPTDRIPEMQHPCSICQKLLPSKLQLQAHCLQEHPGEKAFSCGVCGISYSSLRNAEKHEQITHKRQGEYLCLHCDEKLPTYELFRKHNATHKTDAKKCCLCNETFPLLKLLIQHCNSAHPGQRPFVCDICGASYSAYRMFRVHRTQSHTSEQLLTADRSIKWDPKPRKKKFFRNEKGKFTCEICGKQVLYLANHMEVHEEQGRHLCDICGVGFKSRSYLQVHKRRHAGDRKHPCPLCEKSFYLMTELRLHSKTHDKKYKCVICPEAFVTERLLRKHSGLHDLTRPYRCEICGYMFHYKCALAVHFKKKHFTRTHDPLVF